MKEAGEALTESTFLILLSLVEGPRHGYAILREVEEGSGGRVVLGTGTLYGAIRRFLEKGWICRVADPEPVENNRERQSYNLTPEGRRVVADEAKRLESMLRVARLRLAQEEA